MNHNYKSLLQKIYSLKTVADLHSKQATPQLLRCTTRFKKLQKLSEIQGNPFNYYDIIHVAGTNGKGSICNRLAHTLHHSNKKVGLLTSPHINSFRERIQVDNEMISKEELVEIYENLINLTPEDCQPISLFMFHTLVAFEYFRRKKVDVAIIESGIGGYLDISNIITNKKLAIVTSIGYDHCNILGDTLEKIAEDKCRIFRKNCPSLIGPTVNHDIAKKMADSLKSPLYSISSKEAYKLDYSQVNNL